MSKSSRPALINTNISGDLFLSDEKVAADSGSNIRALINQSRMSTYYQDNPYGTLLFSDKFGVPTLGGPVVPQTPGHRPGNLYSGKQVLAADPAYLAQKDNTIKMTEINGIIVPKNMARWT